MDKKVIRAALLGFGTVGTGVYKVLQKQKEDMIPKLGSQIEIKKILVRNLEKAAAKVEDPAVLTNNWDEIVNDPEIDIVIELIGGIEPARSYILAAINAGKHVVTANKDLIAVHGKELLDAAEAHHVDFLFEAAVAGGIPIIRPLKECLAGNHMAEVMGIVNGTTNFILTKMTQDGMEFKDALALATELGYDGYPKLQKAMQEMIRDKLTSVQRIEVTSSRIGNDDVLNSVLNQDIDKIRRTIEETSHEDFERAVDKICNADRIYIFGVRSTAAIASFLGYYFELIFDNVRVIDSTSHTTTYERIFRMTDKDVMIGISFPRYSTMAVDAMNYARSQGAHAIAITDSMVSPLVKSADSVLIARSDMASIVDSLVAPLSLINALIVATVLKKKDEVSENFRRLETVWNREGVYASGEKDEEEETEAGKKNGK